jgi:hypothetical protein
VVVLEGAEARKAKKRAKQEHPAVIRLQHPLLPTCIFCVRKPLQQYFNYRQKRSAKQARSVTVRLFASACDIWHDRN